MGNFGFYVDMESCVGCRACQIACKDRNKLGVDELFRQVDTYQVGTYPTARLYNYSSSCNHCEEPECVLNCPTGAMYKDEETGIVMHEDARCIGCKTCVSACPYTVPQYIAAEDIVRKCDTCASLREAGYQTACVAACNMRALDFGTIEELEAKYGAECVSELPILPSKDKTKPSIRINAVAAALEKDFVKKIM